MSEQHLTSPSFLAPNRSPSISPGRDIQIVILADQKLIQKTCNHSVETEFALMRSVESHKIGRVIQQLSSNSYIMEYYSKGTLPANGPMSLDRAKYYFRQMCECVDVIHSKGIAHLDIRLSNFVLDDNDNVRIIDFGHARDKDCKDINDVLGSNKYNAPERFLGKYDGYKADIYSLGVILFRLVTGVYPFKEATQSHYRYQLYSNNPTQFWKHMQRHLNHSSQGTKLTPEFIELIDSMLDKNPILRPTVQSILGNDFLYKI